MVLKALLRPLSPFEKAFLQGIIMLFKKAFGEAKVAANDNLSLQRLAHSQENQSGHGQSVETRDKVQYKNPDTQI